MPRFVTANKQNPLVKINRPKHRVRLHDFAQRQTVAGQDCGAKIFT